MKKMSILLMLIPFISGGVSAEMPREQMNPDITQTETGCNIFISNSNIEYGNQSRWQLQDTSGTVKGLTPGKRQLVANLVCPYPHTLRLTTHGDTNSEGNFRYGKSGEMVMRVVSAQLDNQDVQLALSTPEGTLLRSPVSTLKLLPEQTFTPVINGVSAEGKILNLRLEIEPVLAEKDARVNNRQTSEANFSIELR